ncbi:HAD-IA family hydrolase [Streptomyces sp. NBC_00236]|uniref:HAD family hydrolase n=1 Tax=unclassified Streptomyces TaxID=2593676 RepID=UPI002E2C883D|nr:HAD-IA family hydrolase [Streptomyces sp. NBC_00236]
MRTGSTGSSWTGRRGSTGPGRSWRPAVSHCPPETRTTHPAARACGRSPHARSGPSHKYCEPGQSRHSPTSHQHSARCGRGGTRCAAVSASRHAGELLESAGIHGLFDVVVDGGEAARLGLPGKPDPALFLEAASRLRVHPRHTAVVEDAVAGVEAGRRGEFGLVIGVNRTSDPRQAAALTDRGADLVVRDLTELIGDPPGAPS